MAPLAPQRYGLQFTIAQGTYERLCRVQELMGHSTPQSQLAEVFDQALELLERQLQRRKFAATDRPREKGTRPSRNPRHMPARVKRAVWARDGGRCTFVSENGQRCPAREGLEYDHSEPVARGGDATVATIRLRCRAHNQLEAERTFGAGFMHEKREAARTASKMRRRVSPARSAGAPPVGPAQVGRAAAVQAESPIMSP